MDPKGFDNTLDAAVPCDQVLALVAVHSEVAQRAQRLQLDVTIGLMPSHRCDDALNSTFVCDFCAVETLERKVGESLACCALYFALRVQVPWRTTR
jgi:hypothetical protein